MPKSNNIALKIFSQAFNNKDVEDVLNQIVSTISKETGKAEDEIRSKINENLSFSKDLQDKIIKEFEKAEKSLGGRSFTFSKDLFKNLFDADGAEGQINEIIKTFENKIESLIRIKDRINNDEIFFKIDTTQLDELIEKEEKLIELEEKRQELLNSGKSTSGNTKSRNKIQKEIDDIISNLNIDSGKVIDSKEVQQEVNKSKKSIKELKKELNSIYDKNISPDTTNKKQIDDMKEYIRLYHEYVELVKSSGGTIDGDLEGGFKYFLNNNEVKAYNDSLLKSKQNTSAANTELNKYIVTLDEAKQKAQELVKNNNLRPSNITDNINMSEIKDLIGYVERFLSLGGKLEDLDFTTQRIYGKKDQISGIDELTNAIRNYKNEAQGLDSVNDNGFNDNGLKASKEDAEALLSVIKEIRDTLNQLKDKSFLNIGENFAQDLVGGEEKLKETFQALSNTIYNELTDAFNDFVAQLNDVDTKQDWSFNNLRQSLLDIVIQFQNSLASVNLSSTQLDEAYKMIKGWNDADSYSVTRGNATSHERGAFLNSKTGMVSNSYFIDAEKSFGVQLFNALEKLSVGLNGEISSIYDTFIHSHPFRTTIDNLKTAGSDIGFSYSDLDVAISKFLKEKINNMMVTSNYKYANLDLSGVEETIAKELLKHFRSELVKSGLELDGSNRIVFPKDLATNNGVFDFDQKSEIVNGALKQALKNVGLDESRLTTGNIEDLKIDMSQLGSQSEEIKGTFQELLNILKNISNVLTEINTKGFKFDAAELSVSDQSKLQSELDKTKGKLESLSKEAEETKKQLDELKQANVGAAVSQGAGEQPEKSHTPNASESEQQALGKLEEAISTVKKAIDNKTESIKTEENQMNDSVNAEIKKLEELKGKLTEIKTQFESGIASGLFKDVDGNDTAIPGEVTLSPKLSETFKTDADKLLSEINIEKEVNFKVGQLSSTSNDNIDSKFSESFSDSIINDFDIKDKDIQKRVEELVKSLSDISINEILSGKENNNFISVLNELGDLITKNANIIQQKTGIYDDFYNYLKGISNIKIPDIVKTDLGDDWNTLRKTWSQKFSTTKGIELDSIYQEMSNEFKDLFSGTADPTEQFKEIVNAIKLYREDVKKAIPLTDDDIQEIYNQVVNRIGEMRNKIKTDLGVSLDESEFKDLNKENNIRLEPLVDQSEWEEEIDKIILAINKNPKKIKIEPDTSSNEWNDFKTFINEISNKVLNLKIEADKDDVPNFTKTQEVKLPEIKDLNKTESNYEKIVEAARKVNSELGETVKVIQSINKDGEISFRITDDKGNSVSLDKNNFSSRSIVQDNISQQKEIEKSTAEQEKKNIAEANALLGKQLNLFKQMHEIQSNILKLERMDTSNKEDNNKISKEIESLKEKKELLQQEYIQNNKNLSQYDSYIDKQEQQSKFKEISDGFISKDSADAYKELNSAFKEYESIQTRIAKNEIKGIDNKDTGLLEERAKLLDRINKIQGQIKQKGLTDTVKDVEFSNQNKELEKNIELLYAQAKAQKEAKDSSKSSNVSYGTSDENLQRVIYLYDTLLSVMQQIKTLQDKSNNNGLNTDEEQYLIKLQERKLELENQYNKELDEGYNKTAKIQQVLNNTNDLISKDVDGINFDDKSLSGKETNIDISYENAEKINATLNRTSSLMDELSKKNIQNFDKPFNEASIEVEKLNNRLTSGSLNAVDYEKSINKIVNRLNNIVAVLDEASTKADGLNKIKQYLSEISNGDYEIVNDKTVGNVTTLTAEFVDQNKQLQRVRVSYDDITKQIVNLGSTGKKNITSMSRFIDELSAKFRNLGTYLLSFVGFYEIWGAIKQGVTYVRDLDTALTEMRKVSDETVESLREFQEESFKTADSIGATAKEISNSAADFMRLGYSLQEASQLAKDANIYANVGDMDIDEATEHMVSSIKAWGDEFNSEVEASTAIIDRYNEIGNNFAISSADIGSAMERSGAALKAAGNDLNEALGLITAGNLIQQDADVTAAALRTMALRIRGAKSELEELGEETDGVTASTSKLREEIKVLSGVDIMLDED